MEVGLFMVLSFYIGGEKTTWASRREVALKGFGSPIRYCRLKAIRVGFIDREVDRQ